MLSSFAETGWGNAHFSRFATPLHGRYRRGTWQTAALGGVAMGGFLRAHGHAIATAIAVVALLSCAPAALAWGPRGHRIVARLAETQLTPQARAEARKLLALRGARHLSDVAVWA